MQFSCDSCKAPLQIADEKVKGKRLLVRCKRCGAKITISDPALAATSLPAPASAFAPESAAAAKPAARRVEPEGDRDTDTESTRAMDSDQLEKALRASKEESTLSSASGPAKASLDNNPVRPAVKSAPPPQPREATLTPRDPDLWFAMIGGKQTGPMGRSELSLRTAQGGVGPRTYLWKEGMASWLRAKDLTELAALFELPPEATPDSGNLNLGSKEAKRTRRGQGREAAQKAAAQAPAAKPFAEPTLAEQKKPAPKLEAKTPPRGTRAHQAIKPGDDEGNAANIGQLSAGERVHQEGIASELFDAGEQGETGASAADLARWASAELDKQKVSQPNLKSLRQKTPLPVPLAPEDAPALAPVRPVHDQFAQIRARKSSAPLVMTILVVLAVGAYATLGGSGSEAPKAEVAHEVVRPSLGGTGEKVELTKPDAPETQRATAPSGASKPAKPKDSEKLSADQEAAMKSLDNERGIGTHGPKAAPAAETPAPESAGEVLTSDQVRKKLDENKGALQSCIDDALHRNPNLRVGKILIATTISPSGAVTGAKIDKRTVDESPLGSCLKRATRRIVFPSFSGEGFEVDIPISVNANQ